MGKSVSIRSRARAHFAPSTQRAAWTQAAEVVDYKATCSELGALILENRLIKSLRPPGNVKLARRPDERLVYLVCRLDIPYPILELSPAPAAGHAVTIGPLKGRSWVAELIEQLDSLFALRHCGRLSIIRNGILKTPIMLSPRTITMIPPILAIQSRYSISAVPIALAIAVPGRPGPEPVPPAPG